MMRLLVVVALLADGVESGDELGFGKRVSFGGGIHSCSSMPS